MDTYAAGLTFLAILQAEKEQKLLIPHIETPKEDSEIYADSIGRLIAERIKYKVPELNIVLAYGEQGRIKWLISQMTHVEPEERWTAAKVLHILNNLETAEVDLTPEVREEKYNYCIIKF